MLAELLLGIRDVYCHAMAHCVLQPMAKLKVGNSLVPLFGKLPSAIGPTDEPGFVIKPQRHLKQKLLVQPSLFPLIQRPLVDHKKGQRACSRLEPLKRGLAAGDFVELSFDPDAGVAGKLESTAELGRVELYVDGHRLTSDATPVELAWMSFGICFCPLSVPLLFGLERNVLGKRDRSLYNVRTTGLFDLLGSGWRKEHGKTHRRGKTVFSLGRRLVALGFFFGKVWAGSNLIV
jgi:hypothetical protein